LALPRPAADVVSLECCLHLVPERARLPRRPLVGGCLAHEVEAIERARARRIEEVTVAADGVGTLQARAALVEDAPLVVVEEGRRRAASRQASLFKPKDEHDVEPPRAGAPEIEHG